MAIGSLDRAGRLSQLRTFAAVQVRSGYRPPAEVSAETYEAVLAEVGDAELAGRLSAEYVSDARSALAADSATWPGVTDVDRLMAAIDDLRAADIVVLEACDDHWAAQEALEACAARGARPAGIAFFTQTDVWHAVEHGMLEVNLWHGDGANVADDDRLLSDVQAVLAAHGIGSAFDEGRIEVTVAWQRRPGSLAG